MAKPKRSAFLPDHTAWLAVFVPAVAYLIATRIWLFPNSNGASSSAPLLDEGSSIFSRSYIRVTSNRLYLPSLSEMTTNNTSSRTKDLQSLFYVTSSPVAAEAEADPELFLGMKPGVQLVLEGKPLREIQSMVWRHDEELGRGYLLLSDSFGSGRIWRWEVGGGPICIGRSLHMDHSGCRSRVNCTVGSGGMAIDPPSSSLVVAEWGQERIIRLESETGSRTPLVWTVPDSSSTTTTHNTNPVTQQRRRRRLHRPNHLLYTPFGDLLFVDHEKSEHNENETDPTASVAGVYRLREAVHVPPLPPHKSREAHDWTEMPIMSAAMTTAPAATELLFQEHVQQIGGLALDANLTGIYISAIVPTIRDDQEQHQRHVLLHIPLQEDDDETENDSSDDDDDDGQTEDVGAKKEVKEDDNEKEGNPSMDRIQKGLLDGTAREVMDLTPLHEKGSHGNGSRMFAAGPVTVDEKGHVYVAVGGSLIVLNPSGSSVLGVIPLGLNDEGDSIMITDVVLGEDGFLYVSTLHQLLRLRTKAKPMSVPTNLIPPQRTQGFTWD